jgi:hemoglobin
MHVKFSWAFGSGFDMHLVLIPSRDRNDRPLELLGDIAMGLYEDLGGAAAVDAAVDIFYRKVLKDGRISRFFSGVDMAKQAAKQKSFLTMAFGGPNNYTGLDMRKGHAHLVKQGLNDSHFDAVVEDLGATLKELKVPDHLIAKVAAIAETTRNDVLGR